MKNKITPIQKDMQKGIIYGADESYYQMIYYSHRPLSKLSKKEIEELIYSAKKYCTGDVKILNTNLDAFGIKI